MADTGPTKQDAAPWLAMKDATVVGARLLDIADWIAMSDRAGEGQNHPSGTPRLLLPSIQRGSVWRPGQVLSFWDSLLRGLPVGAFYLVESKGGRKEGARGLSSGTGVDAAVTDIHPGDYLLLDGQQRMRALLAGLAEHNDEKRCIWIDVDKLGDKGTPQVNAPYLFLTSKAQPFGYDSQTGTKLLKGNRRSARLWFTGKDDGKLDPIYLDDAGTRHAYDKDIFDTVTWRRAGNKFVSLPAPPQPYEARKGRPVQLWKLFEVWKKGDSGVSDLIKEQHGDRAQPSGLSEAGIAGALDTIFSRLRSAEIALIKVQLPDVEQEGGPPGREELHTVSTLFARIGAGGTALTAEERLYSIYKHYEPTVHRLVETIRMETGNVLPAVKIASAALRIANIRSSQGDGGRDAHYDTPDEQTFIKAIVNKSGLKTELDRLLPPYEHTSSGPLASAFQFLHKAVRGRSVAGTVIADYQNTAFWIPDVLLASLPAQLWEVLTFWAVQNGHTCNPDTSRKQIVRFILYWLVCVTDNKKACKLLLERLADPDSVPSIGVADTLGFPDAALYRILTEVSIDQRLALKLVCPSTMSTFLQKGGLDVWRSWRERFEGDAGESDSEDVRLLAAKWWPGDGSGVRILPWFQRKYIVEKFADYLPLGHHEDDLPYDVDHICPAASWNWTWGGTKGSKNFPDLQGKDLDTVRWSRSTLGNSLGNLQLLDSSENRSAQDGDLTDKPFTMCDSNSPEWKFVTSKQESTIWPSERCIAFQTAVEKRAAWFYTYFYEQLAYNEWNVETQTLERPEPT